MIYKVEFVRQAAKQFRSLSKKEQQKLKTKIDKLAINPRPTGVVKLSGKENLYRIRVGNYRVIYSIKDNQLLILVLKIGHRRDVYR